MRRLKPLRIVFYCQRKMKIAWLYKISWTKNCHFNQNPHYRMELASGMELKVDCNITGFLIKEGKKAES